MLEGVFVDPSAAGFIAQLREDGVPNVRKADNSVLEGISLISSLVENDKFRVLRICAHTIEEILSYAWDTKAATAGEDRPIKLNDHCVDALRYGAMANKHEWRRRLSIWPQ